MTDKLKVSKVQVNGSLYERTLVQTRIITENDSIEDLLEHLDGIELKKDDILVISEKVLSIIENRIINIKDVKVGFFAKILSKFVQKTPGSNLSHPEVMQVAINEVGLLRILYASVGAVVGKVMGKDGTFYILAGSDVRGIDAPDDETVDGFKDYISLMPKTAQKVSNEASNHLGCRVVVLDANYRGINIVASSDHSISEDLMRLIMKDNPMGQKDEQTPMCIIRELSDEH